MLNTVAKIGRVLELFTPEHPEWRLVDIARELEIPKSSAHGLLASLADIGILTVTPRSRYRLGWHLLALAERMRASLDFTGPAVGVMQRLSAELRETILLAVLDRHFVLYVERAEGNHPLVRLSGARPGTRLPAHRTAVGKVLLAHADPADVRSRFERVEFDPRGAGSVHNINELERVLMDVRRDGYATDLGEVSPEVACVAAPVRDRHGTVVAAMSVSMPSYRLPTDYSGIVRRMRSAVSEASDAIAAAQLAADEDIAPPAAQAV
jgi:DNA-binding IclR family transcriptional regulator